MSTLAHPLITITNVIWSFDRTTQQVNVLLIKRSGQPFANFWALPETAMRDGESAHEAALRLVREKIGLRLDAGFAEQLATFTAPERDPSERALSLSYMIYLPERPALVSGPGASDAQWFALGKKSTGGFSFSYRNLHFHSLKPDEYLTDQTPSTGLAFDHNWILTVACARIRNKIDYQPAILFILGSPFTLRQARLIFAAFGRDEPDNSNFLRNHAAWLRPTGDTTKVGVGRPSKTYVLTL